MHLPHKFTIHQIGKKIVYKKIMENQILCIQYNNDACHSKKNTFIAHTQNIEPNHLCYKCNKIKFIFKTQTIPGSMEAICQPKHNIRPE